MAPRELPASMWVHPRSILWFVNELLMLFGPFMRSNIRRSADRSSRETVKELEFINPKSSLLANSPPRTKRLTCLLWLESQTGALFSGNGTRLRFKLWSTSVFHSLRRLTCLSSAHSTHLTPIPFLLLDRVLSSTWKYKTLNSLLNIVSSTTWIMQRSTIKKKVHLITCVTHGWLTPLELLYALRPMTSSSVRTVGSSTRMLG